VIRALGPQAGQCRSPQLTRRSASGWSSRSRPVRTAQEIKVTYSDYGNATAAQKPPADQVVEAPVELYNLFN
jgi:hypothetical protein